MEQNNIITVFEEYDSSKQPFMRKGNYKNYISSPLNSRRSQGTVEANSKKDQLDSSAVDFNEQRKFVHKSLSQADINQGYKNKLEKGNEDNPFQNLNAAVNILNRSSAKRDNMLPKDSQEHFNSKSKPKDANNCITNDKHDFHKSKTRKHSGHLIQKLICEESMESSQEIVNKDTVNFDQLNLVIHEWVGK